MCVHAIGSGDGTHQSGFQKGGPLIGQTPEATHVILQHTTAVSAAQLVGPASLSLALSLSKSTTGGNGSRTPPQSDCNPSDSLHTETMDGVEPPALISCTN